jgi:hypothetical protein
MKRFFILALHAALFALLLAVSPAGSKPDAYWKAPCGAATSHECFMTKLWGPTHFETWIKVDQRLDVLRYPSYRRELLTPELAERGARAAEVRLAGSMPLLGVGAPPAAGGGGYTGPVDAVPGALVYYSLRGASAATAGNKALNACNVADAACADLSTNASTGNLVVGTIGGQACSVSITSGTYNTATGAVSLVTGAGSNLASGNNFSLSALTGTGTFSALNAGWTATSGTTGTTVNFTGPTGLGTVTITGGTVSVCTGKVFYDQMGGGQCGGNCDISNSTIGNRPILTINCIGSLPCLTFASANSQTIKRGAPNTFAAQAQPFTISVVGFETTNVTGGLLTASGGIGTSFRSTPAIGVRATTDFNVSIASSTWYAIQGIANGASSILYINGASNSGSAGTVGYASGNNPQMGTDDFNEFLNGNIVEGGIWGIGFSSGQQSSMNSNQRTYWGF